MYELRAGWVLLWLFGCGANDEFASQEDSELDRRRRAVAAVVGEAAAARVTGEAERVEPAYTLSLPNGNSIAWYEVLEGIPIAVESGTEPSTLTRPMKFDAHRAGDLFSALFPTAELPLELAELDARQHELEPAYRALATAAPGSRAPAHAEHLPAVTSAHPADLDPPSTPPHCLARSWCGRSGLDWTRTQHERTAPSALSSGEAAWSDASSCVSAGSATHRVRYSTWWTTTPWLETELIEGSSASIWTVSETLPLATESRLADFSEGAAASQCLTGLGGAAAQAAD